jgi:hypothetical protein
MARALLVRVVADDLKEARDRLNQNSDNSSRPPGGRPPREHRRVAEAEEDGEETVPGELRSSGSPAGAAVRDVDFGADAASPRERVKAPSWWEVGHALWLWVFVTAQTVLYQIGNRTQDILMNVGGT